MGQVQDKLAVVASDPDKLVDRTDIFGEGYNKIFLDTNHDLLIYQQENFQLIIGCMKNNWLQASDSINTETIPDGMKILHQQDQELLSACHFRTKFKIPTSLDFMNLLSQLTKDLDYANPQLGQIYVQSIENENNGLTKSEIVECLCCGYRALCIENLLLTPKFHIVVAKESHLDDGRIFITQETREDIDKIEGCIFSIISGQCPEESENLLVKSTTKR